MSDYYPASGVRYRHSGQPEWNDSLDKLEQVDEGTDIIADIGDHYITHLRIEGPDHLSLADIAPRVTHLQLHEVTDVKSFSLCSLKHLMRLELDVIDLSSQWPTLPETSLEELQLVGCNLIEFPKSFAQLKKLRVLSVLSAEKNDSFLESGTAASDHVYETLPPSKSSSPGRSELKIESEIMANLVTLEALNIHFCNVRRLPESFSHLTHLKKLSLQGNHLEVLPEVVTKLCQLEELDMSWCDISLLPESIANLKDLKRLILSGNTIEVIPDAVINLSLLEELTLHCCGIRQLPNGCQGLPNLKHLDISYNQIDELPSWIYKLTSLSFLSFVHNSKLKRLGTEVLKLQLSELDCSGCKGLEEPPYSVCEEGLSAINRYFANLAAAQPVQLVEVPVTVVGNALSGKTSLIKTLKEDKRILTKCSESDRTTNVFRRDDLTIASLEVKLLEFGGNDVYHLANQILTEKKCVPLIVVDLADFLKQSEVRGLDEACRNVCLDWVSHLYLACPGLGSPILVLTHVDQLSRDQVKMAKRGLLQTSQSIKSKLLGAEKEFEGLIPKKLRFIQHLANEKPEVFNEEEIFEFGSDPQVTTNIENLKIRLHIRCREHIVLRPQLWNSIATFIQGYAEAPFVPTAKVEANFPGAETSIVLRSMHSSGQIFFFEMIEELSGHIFHNLEKVMAMINLLFIPASQHLWDERLRDFDTFRHGNRGISKPEYKEFIQRLVHDGVLTEALLKHLLRDSEFPFKVAVELMKCFLILQGPFGETDDSEYLVPPLACDSMGDSWKTDGQLQLRADIVSEGLSVPKYVYQLMLVDIIKKISSPFHTFCARKNGVSVQHGGSSTHVVVDLDSRTIIVQVSTTTQQLGVSWSRLIDATQAIFDQFSQSWNCCQIYTHIYCSHCLFLRDPEPKVFANPTWFRAICEEKGETPIKLSFDSCSGRWKVLCKIKPEIPMPLKMPCFELTDDEITRIDECLQSLEDSRFQPIELLSQSERSTTGNKASNVLRTVLSFVRNLTRIH